MMFSYAYKPLSPLYNTISLSNVEVTHLITTVCLRKVTYIPARQVLPVEA